MNLILEAAQWARWHHRHQKRKYNNSPYSHHPARVAARVALHPDATEEMVAAAFLHDIIEDTKVTADDLRPTFGEAIVALVIEMTNTSKTTVYGQPLLPRAVRKEKDRERLSKISKRAKIIKLVDRIDNLKETDPEDEFSKLYAKESLLLVEVIGDGDVYLKEELIKEANRLISHG